jgi:hypothetical protein
LPPAMADVLSALARYGLLLKQDKRLPNVVSLVTGETVSTSWWSHPQGRLIFSVLRELSEHPDVLLTKLLSGKDTLVHRRLWPAFVAVADSGEPWQRRNLSAKAKSLLSQVRGSDGPLRSSGPAVRELVSRLLVHAVEVHTESGRHETAIEPWSVWAMKAEVVPARSAIEARAELERASRALGAPASALPWSSPGAAR